MSFNECKVIFNKLDSSSTLSEHFFNFVFTKISKKQANRFIEKDHYSIDIIPVSHAPIKVIPIFKDMDKDNLCLHKEIAIASKIIRNSEIKCIYFVYPKNTKFDKHIEVKVTSLENIGRKYIVKVIPYSLNDLYKKGTKRICNVAENN